MCHGGWAWVLTGGRREFSLAQITLDRFNTLCYNPYMTQGKTGGVPSSHPPPSGQILDGGSTMNWKIVSETLSDGSMVYNLTFGRVVIPVISHDAAHDIRALLERKALDPEIRGKA